MKATSKANIKIEGLQELLNKLQGAKPIYAVPWEKALRNTLDMGVQTVQSRAPIKSYTLEGSVTDRMDPKPVPFWGVITANAENKGFRYPFGLEAGKGKKKADGSYSVTHYQRGPRTGKSTRKWFSGAIGSVRKKLTEMMNVAVKEIEAAWQR